MKCKQAIKLAVAAAALCGASAAMAQNVQRPWYVEGSLGASKHGMNGADMDRSFAAQGATTASSFDENDQAWGLKLGYRFAPNWAVEGAYHDLGKFGFSGTTAAPVPGSFSGDYKAQAWSLSGVGTWPVGNAFAVYGKLGVAYTEAKTSVSSTGTPLSGGKSNNTGLVLGLGGTYDFSPAWYARLGWDRYLRVGDDQKTGRGDLDVYAVGIGFRF
jgi:OmpA-OmpF porin, OOP family